MDWVIAIGAYLILLGGLAIVAWFRRPPSTDPRAYETYHPEVTDWLEGVRERERPTVG